MKIKLKENEVLVLRSCNADMTSHGGFVWPKSGYVEAPDWEETNQCGNGLHGLSMGCGDASLVDVSGVGLVVKVDKAQGYVDLGGKCKYRCGEVMFVGSVQEAATIIHDHYPDKHVHFCTATAGDRGTATAGDKGTATAGDYGTATAGDYGTATAGYRGTATAGDWGVIAIRGEFGQMVIAAVDGVSIKANVAYKLCGNAFVEDENV